MINFKWMGRNAQLLSKERSVDLYWNDVHQLAFDGLVINEHGKEYHNAVSLTVDETRKLRDYLNSIIPKGAEK